MRAWVTRIAIVLIGVAIPGRLLAAEATFGLVTDAALFTSSLAALTEHMDETDFVLVPGDFLAHEFEAKAVAALNVDERDPKVMDMAVKTTRFVADSIAQALPDRPIIVALGNNDSGCGDYEIAPGGRYLAETAETVRRLAGPELIAADFDQTYHAGGYYAVQHPGRPETLILVINDVLWSEKYHDACGAGDEAAAQAMLSWLSERLAEQKAGGGTVWLVHHIPWGIDPYSTVHSKAGSCTGRIVPFLREPYADRFYSLLRDYRGIVRASYSGHVHTDDYRLLIDEHGDALGAQKIPPAISPIYDQNPSFEVVTYDRGTGASTDFSTYYLANLGDNPDGVQGDWRFEYTFTKAYDLPDYSAESVAALAGKLKAGGPIADTYRLNYYSSHTPLPATDLPAYRCAIAHLDVAGFAACYCDGEVTDR